MKFKVVKEENSFSAPYYCYAVYADGELLKQFQYNIYQNEFNAMYLEENAKQEAIKYVERFVNLMRDGVVFRVKSEIVYETEAKEDPKPISPSLTKQAIQDINFLNNRFSTGAGKLPI